MITSGPPSLGLTRARSISITLVVVARPFSVIAPTAAETPVIVEIPHAGINVDGPALATLAAPARAIGRDADLWVDELYARAPAHGATMLVAHISRYVVDLNRSEKDVDSETIEGAPPTARATRGIIWRLTSDGARTLEAPLSRAELDRRLETFYRPYHRTLAQLIDEKRNRFGFAIVLAAHSMPSLGRVRGETSAGPAKRADVVPGTRGRTSAAPVIIDAVDRVARAAGYSVAHDEPYQGGFTTMFYGQPAAGVHVVQVELARRLYMDETTLLKTPSFDRTTAFCEALVEALGNAVPA
jgi:N-formylglutamate deformylase